MHLEWEWSWTWDCQELWRTGGWAAGGLEWENELFYDCLDLEWFGVVVELGHPYPLFPPFPACSVCSEVGLDYCIQEFIC